MISFPAFVYFLCFLSGGLCAYLLINAFLRGRERFLLWNAICFCLLSINNLLVFVDLIMLPDTDLTLARSLTSLLAVTVLVCGFIWELD